MNKNWIRMIAPLALACGLSAPSQAVPILFDMAGSVSDASRIVGGVRTTDETLLGQLVNAQFLIDTDAFDAGTSNLTGGANFMTFRDSITGTPAISASVVFNGAAYDPFAYATDRSEVSFTDSLGPIISCGGDCSSLTPDQWAVRLSSVNPGPTGVSAARTLSLIAGETSDPPDPLSGTTWFDFAASPPTPELLLTAPYASLSFPLSLHFSETIFECTDRCRTVGSTNTSVRLTSFSRSVTNVPEPGTLALMGAGLFAALLFRRRQPLTAALN